MPFPRFSLHPVPRFLRASAAANRTRSLIAVLAACYLLFMQVLASVHPYSHFSHEAGARTSQIEAIHQIADDCDLCLALAAASAGLPTPALQLGDWHGDSEAVIAAVQASALATFLRYEARAPPFLSRTLS